MHLPVDHPLRGLYRGLALLIGVFLVVFGIAGFMETAGMPFFEQDGERVFGLTTNPAFSVLNIVVGVLVVVVTAIDRNIDVMGNLALGLVFLLAGMAMLCLLRTNLNFLGFSMTNCIVSFVIGLVLCTAGLYGTTSRARPRVEVQRPEKAVSEADAAASR